MDRSKIEEGPAGAALGCRAAWLAGCGVALAMLWAPPGAALAQTAEAPRSSAAPARLSPAVSIDTFPLEPAPAAAQPQPAPAQPRVVPPSSRKPSAPAPLREKRPEAVSTAADQASTDPPLDVAALRAQTQDQLRALDAPHPAAEDPAATVPREVLQERQGQLDEYDRADKLLRELTHPETSPEKLAEVARADLRRAQEKLAAPAELPAPFLDPAKGSSDAAEGKLKQAIEAAKAELKEAQSRLEASRTELSKAGPAQEALRQERDSLFQQLATLRAAGRDRSSALASPTARRLDQERLTNETLRASVITLRIKVTETRLDRAQKLAEVREINLRVNEARAKVAQRNLDLMQSRYRDLAESRQRDLKRAAETEETRAEQSDDPLDRYRAGRLAELLDLEARIVRLEQALAAGTKPDLEEQKALADRALDDFAEIKQLLDDQNVSRLDALRLTNDFRRIGPERERLLRNEQASIEAQLQFYENGLSNVELELIEDAQADQMERDAVIERLDAARQGPARDEFAMLDRRHRDLLLRRRVALTGLVARASQTMEQVLRRRRVLEDEYGFIRTHIFWVRDQDSLGLPVVYQAVREVRRLARGVLALVLEASNRKLWGSYSTEFLSAAAASLVLPLGLFRLRRFLRRRMAHALPPSHLHGTAAATVRIHGAGLDAATTSDAGR